jgi:hypothetical protein
MMTNRSCARAFSSPRVPLEHAGLWPFRGGYAVEKPNKPLEYLFPAHQRDLTFAGGAHLAAS